MVPKYFIKGVMLGVIALLCFSGVYALVNSSLVFHNQSLIDQLLYDRVDSMNQGKRYGSNSYMDYSLTNPNLFLHLCHPNLTVGQQVDLVYTSESGNLTEGVLNYRPVITTTTTGNDSNGTFSCSMIDVDIASSKALYPGFLTPYLFDAGSNFSYFGKLDAFLNGSFDIGIEVEGPPKTFLISIADVYDHNLTPITRNEQTMLLSLLNGSNESLAEKRLGLGETLTYEGNFMGGETVHVNDVLSLEIVVVDGCTSLNGSGYYILNESSFNLSSSCLVINETEDVVINFGGELLDGNNETSGSLNETVCPILIQDSENITVEDLLTQQFKNGICVVNSSVKVFGAGSTFNENGALVTDGSDVTFVNVYFNGNNENEITAENGSFVSLVNVTFETAIVQSTFIDSNVTSVFTPPDLPDILNITGIDQYIEYRRGSNDSWAQISFVYSEPLPNSVVIDNISIWKFNGTYENVTVEVNVSNGTNGSNTTNVSSFQWVNGNWSQLFTLVSPNESTIIGPNVSNFSVFAPLGFPGQPEETPEPEPEPVTVSSPSGGGGGGGGGTPSRIGERDLPGFPDVIELELNLPNITLEQGQAGNVIFNLTNVGENSADNIVIFPQVPRGWTYTNFTETQLLSGESVFNSFQVGAYEKAIAQVYQLPVLVLVEGFDGQRVALTEILRVNVVPRGDLRRIKMVEYPPVIEIEPFSSLDVSFLVENIGDHDLTDIYVEFDPSSCLTGLEGQNSIRRGETELFSYTFSSGERGVCDYNMKFYEGEELVGFVPVTIIVKTKSIWQTQAFKIIMLLLVLAGWTTLTIWVISRRRKR